MSESESGLYSSSAEFTLLCETQVEMLAEQLEADWSGVYLTQHSQLIPVVVYPTSNGALIEGKETKNLNPTGSIIPFIQQGKIRRVTEGEDNRLILPLIYKGQMLGLLIACRKKRPWQNKELKQIKKIARTIAIAGVLEQKQQWYSEQLSREHQKIDNFLHQLKNPLTALKTFAKLLMRGFLPESGEYKAIKGILRESDRLEDLMLEFETEIEEIEETRQLETRGGTKGLLLPATEREIGAIVIHDILEPLILSEAAVADEKGLTLSNEIDATIPPVSGNCKALREVLSNLIDNAIKYTPRGGEIKIIPLVREKEIGIEIGDSGYGIPPEDKERLFERHYRGKQGFGDIPGTGLGLSIALGLVKQMAGDIDIISPNPKIKEGDYPGSLFIVWLKRYVSASGDEL
ncbi:MAG: Adaptive-response sensory-kinase SasA [Chroococcopsis gigantea SAG 12.99]|jgi:signal transduction histidine kinase|nr:Adaptive-response sensory-kinase SasA [Chroococcopsis gigantea SAG 12.99]